MDKKTVKTIISQYRAGQASAEERGRIEYWFHKLHTADPSRLSPDELESMSRGAWHYIRSHTKPHASRRVYQWLAAAALLLIGVGLYFYPHAPVAPDPGRTPTLTLSDGKIIPLSTKKAGIISGISELIYTDGSHIRGISEQDRANPNLRYKISTPRGGSYFVKLPDGTKVWLSAASSLTYLPAFSDSNRVVELSGEACFDVKRDSRLFHVITAGEQIDAVKAAFNVYAYPGDKAYQVTLLSGNLLVRDLHAKRDSSWTTGLFKPNLTPGQQFVISAKGSYIHSVDTAEALAWRRGTIVFYDADIKEVVRILQRWYDVKAVYKGNIPDMRISGQVKRENLADAIKFLDAALDVSIELKDRTIIIGGNHQKQ